MDWESRIKPLARAAVDDETTRAEYLAVVPSFVGKVDSLVRQIETDLGSSGCGSCSVSASS
jgi:hypothetical protein